MFTAEEIRKPIAVAPDPRFVAYLPDGTPFIAADGSVSAEGESVGNSLLRTAMNMVREAFDAAEAIEVAIRDDRIDHREALVIRRDRDCRARNCDFRAHVERHST
jgi:hypothetical protein